MKCSHQHIQLSSEAKSMLDYQNSYYDFGKEIHSFHEDKSE